MPALRHTLCLGFFSHHPGVVSVRVLRPWNEEALRQVVPASAKRVHVFDDVPSELTQGNLYVDVFSALLDSQRSPPLVKAHRIFMVPFSPSPTPKVLFRRSFAGQTCSGIGLDVMNPSSEGSSVYDLVRTRKPARAADLLGKTSMHVVSSIHSRPMGCASKWVAYAKMLSVGRWDMGVPCKRIALSLKDGSETSATQ